MELKEAYLERRETQLKQWDAEIQKLVKRAEHELESLPIEFNEQLRMLRATRKAAEIKLRELKHSTVDAWDHCYGEVEHLWQEFESSLTEALTKSLQCQMSAVKSRSADNRPWNSGGSVTNPNSLVAPRD